ncbi:hypothetical protein PG994_000712 [Apiospora phragmitis]|uniref:Helicase C-terminal domain-containing protein n=1 Tax=Apiospora phragmitis TaxID=2905665 RepID=A0ABR1X770_9PEZI
MSDKAKTAAKDTFYKIKNVKIMIISLKCGGAGLNLTCANRVILIDPWWNESIEQQAFGRVYRIGQEKETYLQRILVRNSIDERLHNKQLEKPLKIEQAVQCSKGLSAMEMIGLLGRFTTDENGNHVLEADYDDD